MSRTLTLALNEITEDTMRAILELIAVPNIMATYIHSDDTSLPSQLIHVLNGIASDGSYQQISVQNWPKNSKSFYISREAYDAMPEKYDTYIKQLWSYQYENNFNIHAFIKLPETSIDSITKSFVAPATTDFRSKYPTFESYKNAYLQYGLVQKSVNNNINKEDSG